MIPSIGALLMPHMLVTPSLDDVVAGPVVPHAERVRAAATTIAPVRVNLLFLRVMFFSVS
jgi:hypothetical protein